MNLFASVDFGPSDVLAVASGNADTLPRCVRMAVLTSQTCGEPCWHAREEVCRCSCGGRNHGCLLVAGGERPVRMAKIGGERYKLAAVGLYADLIAQAGEINGRQWRGMEKPQWIVGSMVSTESEAMAAKARGEDVWCSQYHYKWSATDEGAPARLKTATPEQLAKWDELKGWKERGREGVYILWEIEMMPAKPTVLRVNRQGVALANQSPIGDQV